jgi:WD40 repeat protein
MGTILYTDSDDALRQWPLRWLVEAGTNKLSFGTAENISARPNFDRYCRPFDQPPTTAALVSNGKVHLVDLASRREKNVLTATKPFGYASLSHNGRWCAASSYDDANVTVFELSNSIALKVLPAALQAKTMAFSPNNRWLVTGDNQQFQFWDTAGWKCVFALPRTATAAGPGVVAFSSDSLLVAVTISAQLVRLMDTANGNQLATLESSAPQNIGSMEFSPNGSQLAMLGYGPVHYLQLWDLRLLREQLAAMKLDW